MTKVRTTDFISSREENEMGVRGPQGGARNARGEHGCGQPGWLIACGWLVRAAWRRNAPAGIKRGAKRRCGLRVAMRDWWHGSAGPMFYAGWSFVPCARHEQLVYGSAPKLYLSGEDAA